METSDDNPGHSEQPRPSYTDSNHLGQSPPLQPAPTGLNPVPEDDQSDLELLRQALCPDDELDSVCNGDGALIKQARKGLREPVVQTPLWQTDCSDLDSVLHNAHVPHHLRVAGFVFLGRLKKWPWLKKVDDGQLPSRIALALALADFGFPMALCGHGRWPCRSIGNARSGQPLYCPRQ